MQPPGLFENLRRRLHQPAHRPPAAVVDQNFDRPELAGDPPIRGRDLRLDGGVTLDRQRNAAGGLDLARDDLRSRPRFCATSATL